jgi:acetylornithine aminotransferase
LVKAVTGKGLMIGLVMPETCAELVSIALEHKLLINVTAGTVVRLLPALTLEDHEADMIGERLANAIDQYANQRV